MEDSTITCQMSSPVKNSILGLDVTLSIPDARNVTCSHRVEQTVAESYRDEHFLYHAAPGHLIVNRQGTREGRARAVVPCVPAVGPGPRGLAGLRMDLLVPRANPTVHAIHIGVRGCLSILGGVKHNPITRSAGGPRQSI